MWQLRATFATSQSCRNRAIVSSWETEHRNHSRQPESSRRQGGLFISFLFSMFSIFFIFSKSPARTRQGPSGAPLATHQVGTRWEPSRHRVGTESALSRHQVTTGSEPGTESVGTESELVRPWTNVRKAFILHFSPCVHVLHSPFSIIQKVFSCVFSGAPAGHNHGPRARSSSSKTTRNLNTPQHQRTIHMHSFARASRTPNMFFVLF